MKKMILPISADPLTNGHLDLITRGMKIAEPLIIAVLNNNNKSTMFDLREREVMIKEVLQQIPHLCQALKKNHIKVLSYPGLLTDLAVALETNCIIRGVRNDKDWHHEETLKKAYQNQLWNNEQPLKFIYLRANKKTNCISSSLVKSIFAHHGNIAPFVPLKIKQKMEKKILGKKKIIITGSIASGKTTCARLLSEMLGKDQENSVISFDEMIVKIYQEIEKGQTPALAEKITKILPKDMKKEPLTKKLVVQSLTKMSLRQAKPFLEKLQILFSPYLRLKFSEKMQNIAAKKSEGFIILDAPMAVEYDLLPEANNVVVLVQASLETQLRRLKNRHFQEEKEARKRIVLAGSYEEKKLLIEKKIAFYNCGECFVLNADQQDNTKNIKDLAHALRAYFDKV